MATMKKPKILLLDEHTAALDPKTAAKVLEIIRKYNADTGASLRAIEIEADVMFKGTRVDGVYTADPEKDPSAVKYDTISYDEMLAKGLKVMDLTATVMCKENHMPVAVFDMDTPGNLKRILAGENIGTVLHE